MRRTLPQKMEEAARQAGPFSGIAYRNVAQKFATSQDILSAGGSVFTGGRYNFRGTYPVLYLSCDIHTCLEETTRSFQQAGASVALSLPRTLIGVQVELAQVLDLTDPAVLRFIGITRVSLTRTDWAARQDVDGEEAWTQKSGRLVRSAGAEAVLAPSAAAPRTGKNLAVFVDRLRPGSSLRAVNAERLRGT